MTDRICVVDEALASCLNMVADTNALTLEYECVRARDRLECLKLIQNGLADFAPFEPEDMYIAAKFMDDSLAIFLEMRNAITQLDVFRFLSVAVVRNDANINYPADLRGKVSCHTGYGRTAGWHMPIPRLMTEKLIKPDCTGLNPVNEHELAAVSDFFSRACVPGKWSPDEATDQLFKRKYPNLCSACNDPYRCSDGDEYSGFEGTLRCVTQGLGQVAWTSYTTVRRVFGMDTVTPSSEIVNFSFLCPEGGRRPLTSPFPCVWSAKPWNAYLTRKVTAVAVLRDMQARIVRAVELARTAGNVRSADWLTRVLGFEPDAVAVPMDELSVFTSAEYLARSNFTLSIEGRGCRGRILRFCVVSEKEQRKCQDLRMAALSRRVLPEISCIRGSTTMDCMDRIRRGEADMRTFDSNDAFRAGRSYNLKPIVTEIYPNTQESASFAVAVVKSNSGINRLEDLREKRSCHTGFGRTAGWNIPVFALSQRQLIYPQRCRFGRAVSQFFSQSCVPGAKDFVNDIFRDNPLSLCSMCVGNQALGGAGRCSSEPTEELFAGFRGAFHCLVEGGGDVAFVRHTTPFENTDGNNLENWAVGLSSNNFRLLCLDGGVRPVQEYQTCNLGKVPAPKVMTDGWKSAERTQDIRAVLLRLSDLFSPSFGGQVIFRLFGPYEGVPNLLFTDFAERLGDLGPVDYIQGLGHDFVRMMEQTTCGSGKLHHAAATGIVMGVFTSLLAIYYR
ncbi:transferrin-like isoform X2 [Daphnia pulex]|uniref:transferrin-like isoform X2 n=1 Tax=Daphnia pulex TaxID=6669 RepID=UPI001EDCD068|nr:transferrin-like isoform X2 [Daphnia pulex]XP_046649682.1 transferrin-like isoform X2 [Daphnia pulicaria]